MSRTRLVISAALLLALLTSFATAQIDDRSRELLEGLSAAAENFELTTLDQTMVMTIPPQDGQAEIVTRTRMAVDFENERAAFVTELAEGMATRMVHQNGQTVMHMAGMPMAMPVPAPMATAFDSVFEPPTMNLLDQEGASATYDGVVAYGDVLEGHQVTFTGNFDPAGMSESSESKLIFDDAGNLIGMASDVSGDVVVMVYDDPFDPAQPLATRNMTMYELSGDDARLYATMVYEDVRVNEPLDEAFADAVRRHLGREQPS